MRVPQRPPNSGLSNLSPSRIADVVKLGTPTVGDRYLHWDEIRRRRAPKGLSSEEWWAALKLNRGLGRKKLPFTDIDGVAFSYVLTDQAMERLHLIDRSAVATSSAPEPILNQATRNRYLVSGRMEEAIASSLLEGAVTTRSEAKALLRSRRAPLTLAERMVVNNYRAMQEITDDISEPITIERLLDLHRTLTEGTLGNPADAGRFQGPTDERVVVADYVGRGEILHRPPPASEIPSLMDRLVTFANGKSDRGFMHPVVRAVALHFLLAYIHPFADGNGRTARALFYWSMLQQQYWLTEYLSISRLLNRAPTQYGRAFLYTETDEADFTYFLLHQLDVIRRSIDELNAYLKAKNEEVRAVERALQSAANLNHRQLALLSHAVRHPDAVYTFATHRSSHGVVYQTARLDLLDLEARGFVERGKVGRELRFYPAPDLADRVRG